MTSWEAVQMALCFGLLLCIVLNYHNVYKGWVAVYCLGIIATNMLLWTVIETEALIYWCMAGLEASVGILVLRRWRTFYANMVAFFLWGSAAITISYLIVGDWGYYQEASGWIAGLMVSSMVAFTDGMVDFGRKIADAVDVYRPDGANRYENTKW